MTFGELIFFIYMYNMMPVQGRRRAWDNVGSGLFLMWTYVYMLPYLINGIRRNIMNPGYVNMHVKNIKLTDSDNMDSLYDAYGFNGNVPYIGFDGTLRNMYMTHVSFENAKSPKNEKLQNFAKDFEIIAMAHEKRHAMVNKYVCSMFFRKRNFYYIYVLDEISSIIQEQLAYTGMDSCQGSTLFRANQVHSKIIKSPKFRGCKKDLTSMEYITLFNQTVVSDTYVQRIMINGAIKRFEDCMSMWCKSISEIKCSQMPFSVDFYRMPISFDTARRKILTYDIGGKSVSFYDAMSAQNRARFDERIYAIADIICAHTR